MENETILPGYVASEAPQTPAEPAKKEDRSFKQMIRAMNLKVTDQRLLILATLYEGLSHVTVQELYELVCQKDASIGFATVYRFLKMLTEHGFVTELRVGGHPARYELTPTSHHDHITCIKCSKICEFENSTIEDIQMKVAQQFGFKLTGHVLELYGICPECQLKTNPTSTQVPPTI